MGSVCVLFPNKILFPIFVMKGLFLSIYHRKHRRNRRYSAMQRGPRAEVINETYYAKNNEPSFYQFGKNYHFYDDDGRKYMIATENDDTFQNKLLRTTPDTLKTKSDSYGEVTLYVKLSPTSDWFEERQVGKPFVIYSRKEGLEFVIQLSSIYRESYKRRTGTVTVKGLGKLTCNAILANQ